MINTILKAGMYAPSAGNQQPWHFVVIKERSVLEKIPHFHPYAEMLKIAPAAVVVCCDMNLEKHKGMWEQDCSAATQNMLLAAHSMGIANCWLGVFPREDRISGIRELIELPENVMPFCIIALGYSTENSKQSDRFNPERIHYNRW